MKGKRYPAIWKAGPFKVHYYDSRMVWVESRKKKTAMDTDALIDEIAALLNAEWERQKKAKRKVKTAVNNTKGTI